jgi:hypothetical protein
MALVDGSEAALRAVRSLGLSPSDVADVLRGHGVERRNWEGLDHSRGGWRLASRGGSVVYDEPARSVSPIEE